MNALEQEIIDKFHQLDADARRRVRQAIQSDSMAITMKVGIAPFDFATWMAEVEANAIQLHNANGDVISASDLLNEVREERDDDILRSAGFGDSAGNRTD